MATNTGEGHRTGSVKNRTEVKNTKTKKWVERDLDPASGHGGEFIDVKKDGSQHKGVANEPDKRRKT